MSSYIIIHKGKFTEEMVHTSYVKGRINQAEEVLEVIEDKWKKSCVHNTKLFNGELFRLVNYNIENDLIEFNLSDTDYKEYVGTRDIDFVSRFGNDKSSNPISVGAILVTLDNKIILGERSNDVDSQKSKIAVIGGNADPRYDFIQDKPDIFGAMRREIVEELGIRENLISDLRIIGLVSNLERYQTFIPFQGKILLNVDQIHDFDKKEFSRIVILDNSEKSVIEFLTKMRNSLSDITEATFEIYSEFIGSSTK